MLYFQLERFLFRTSPADVWPNYPRREELDTMFRAASRVPPQARAEDPAYRGFTDAVLSWYFGQLDTGAIVSISAGCADIVRLWAGFTPAEVLDLARENLAQDLVMPFGRRPLGSFTVTRGARFLKESRALLRNLQEAGFRILAVSGSSTWSVVPVFERLGVSPDQVLGIGLTTSAGVLTAEVPGPVSVHAGKVQTLQQAGYPSPALTASDSPLDLPLLECSSDLRVFVNTRYPSPEQFFRDLGIQRDGRWVIIHNPTDEPCPTPQ
jgi:phosphoserine phosphatase